MKRRGVVHSIGLAGCGGALAVTLAAAQIALPEAAPPDGATLFKRQCATCHTLDPKEPLRQGPSLYKVLGRRAGKAEGFAYSAGLAKADFVWDEVKLNTWLTNPQAVIPDAFMAYRQSKPEIRAAIIAYLKEQN